MQRRLAQLLVLVCSQVSDRSKLSTRVVQLWWIRRLTCQAKALLVVQAASVLEFVHFDFRWFLISIPAVLLVSLVLFILSSVFRLVGIDDRSSHLRVVRRLQLPVREEIHLLSYVGLDHLQLILLNELCERVDLLLVEQSDKVVAEPPHL